LAEEQQEEGPDEKREEGLFKVSATAKLRDEIESWTPFLESLRPEDKELFKEMIQRSWDYADSVEVCGEEYITEAFLVSLLVSQQKKINFLANQVEINLHKEIKGENRIFQKESNFTEMRTDETQ
jgi:hypothetical protein